MPYPAGHREKIRQKIVQAARRLFNQRGFENVSINEIMGAAGLTRGGFYSYFASKTELYAETLACFFTDPTWKGVEIDLNAAPVGPQVVRAYLSHQHFENVKDSCPMVALPSDVARAGKTAKRAFEGVFAAMVSFLERDVRHCSRDTETAAQAIAALCVGAWSSPAPWTIVDTPTGCATPVRRSRFGSVVGRRRQRRVTRNVGSSLHWQPTIFSFPSSSSDETVRVLCAVFYRF
jgi:AcrR family transcriptional regulator